MRLGIGIGLCDARRGAVPAALGALAYWESDFGLPGSGSVAQWNGKAGGFNLVQGTGANQPTITASAFGALPGVLLDGTNDWLSCDAVAATFSGSDKPLAWALVAKFTGITGQKGFLSLGRGASATPEHYWYRLAAQQGSWRNDDGGVAAGNPGGAGVNVAAGVATLVGQLFSGTQERKAKGTTIDTQVALDRTAVTLDTFTVGARRAGGTASEFLDATLGGLYVFPRDLTAVEWAMLATYCAAKFGT